LRLGCVIDDQADDPPVLGNDRAAAVVGPRNRRVDENLVASRNSLGRRVDYLATLDGDIRLMTVKYLTGAPRSGPGRS